LKRRERKHERQKKGRVNRKRKLQELCEKHPELKKELKIDRTRGRPTVEQSQPQLLAAIVDIATHGYTRRQMACKYSACETASRTDRATRTSSTAGVLWLPSTTWDDLVSVLGRQEVCFISQDDKARVPIGITAANKQPPLLMHADYKVNCLIVIG